MRFLVARMVDRRLGKTRVVDAAEAVRLRSEGWIVLMDPGEFQVMVKFGPFALDRKGESVRH